MTTAVLSGDQSSVPPEILAWEQGGFMALSPVLARQGSPVMWGEGRQEHIRSSLSRSCSLAPKPGPPQAQLAGPRVRA